MSEEFSRVVSALRQYFGFSTFRPLQEEIIRDALAGKDVLALLPTGGGKSLCFQLPAVVQPGLTIVVSPLIALMKDQVDSLQAAGVPATFLNSSLTADQARSRLQGVNRGEFKLVYVAPERLMIPGFLEDLKRWKVDRFAIDEAHCISEWGHDFRPEYRQLAQLRDRFPHLPIMALTATATERVRKDIHHQLRLKEARQYVASFNRPNLTYRVLPKTAAYDQLLRFLRSRHKEAGIVYCQSRKATETLASRLKDDGIPAAPYHAGLQPETRTRHQEQFLRDEVRVICATIAFGMGINKPNVRFVVHHDLPKNLEGYYQETGRAGRDGLPSECLLLYSRSDVIKCERFISEKPDPKDQVQARHQLQLMTHYAESQECRRRTLLGYFGETYSSPTCEGCDNCLTPRDTWEATVPAQKFLSCVYRIREHSGFGTGMAHVVDVLIGSDNQKVHKSGHRQLSTFGIGKEMTRIQWTEVGRELLRLGYLNQVPGQFATVELTALGREALKSRKAILLTRMPAPPPVSPGLGSTVASRDGAARRVGDITCDEVLFEQLRVLRKQLADERDVPAYIVLSDVALRQIARRYPTNDAELIRISGVGEKKLRDFGPSLLTRVADHLKLHPRQEFPEETVYEPSVFATPRVTSTVAETLSLFRSGSDVETICRRRGIVASTVFSHLAAAIGAGETIDTRSLLQTEDYPEIAAAMAKHGPQNLSGALESLNGKFTYGQLRIFRALHPNRA